MALNYGSPLHGPADAGAGAGAGVDKVTSAISRLRMMSMWKEASGLTKPAPASLVVRVCLPAVACCLAGVVGGKGTYVWRRAVKGRNDAAVHTCVWWEWNG